MMASLDSLESDKEIIWITGATSGIGLALTRRLGKQGHRLFISARNLDKLDEIADGNPNIVAIPFDITRAGDVPRVQAALMEKTQVLNRLYINAGNCEYLEISQPDWPMMKRVMDVNYLGAVNTVAAALPLLQQQGRLASENRALRPHIIGVSSQAMLVPFPKAEAYGASKAALSYFLHSLSLDLAIYNIDVTDVQPGFVKTPLTDKNQFDMPFILTAETAAQRILDCSKTRPRTFAFPKRLYWTLKLGRLFPGIWHKLMLPKPDQDSETGKQSK
jgi:short-subunit dehydrogenase